VHICGLFMDNAKVIEATNKLYEDLQKAGIEVLFDDRLESPGSKFNDADLIGIPYRVTISPRTLEGNNVEFKLRRDKKAQIMPLAGLPEFLKERVSGELQKKVQ
jgi:prolyl-tRNA synthetase